MAQVYVGIGSNVEPEYHIRAALAALRQRFEPLTVSTVYANPAVGFVGADFLNLVAGFETELTVYDVAAALRAIEAAYQRPCGGLKLTPRALDLDLLLYGDLVLNEEGGLHIPRAEIAHHAFVLRPLAEIAGERRHPVLRVTFAELWAAFDQARERLMPVRLAPEQ